jgi:hypothetical protein
MIEAIKDWVGHVLVPIRSEIDGPVIGHVIELYPNSTGKCLMLNSTYDTMKLFHDIASINEAIEYRLLVKGPEPTITVEGNL